MQKYIKISNTAENVSRLSLEKLGLSTKRNNPDSIGKFGSGIKFAPIAALRNGWEWHFTGTDSHGQYHLQYVIKDEDGIACVWYDYGDSLKPSSFTAEAGVLSWTDSFQVYREAVSNAIDGAKEFDGSWSIDIVDSVYNEDGVFSVFISASPELMEIYKDHDLYFSNNRMIEFSSSHSKRFALSKVDSNTRVYSHGVLVYKNEDYNSIFDYCFDDIELNEERTVRSEWTLNSNIEMVLCTAPEHAIEKIVKACINANSYFEFNNSNGFNYISAYTFKPYWLKCFQNMYGDTAVILDNATARFNIENALRMRGLKPVLIDNDNAFKLLKAAGIPTAMDKLGEHVKYQIDADIEQYPKLMEAVSIARIAEPGLERFIKTLAVFDAESSETVGLTINMSKSIEDRQILIAKDHARQSSVQNIIATILHEYDHAMTGIADSMDNNGRMFRELADQRIGELVYENYMKNPFFIRDGVICFDVDNMARIGRNLVALSEHVRLIDGYVIKIGNHVLKAFGSNIEQNFGHEHQPHFADGASVVSYPTFINVESISLM